MEYKKGAPKTKEELIINLSNAKDPIVILSQPEKDSDNGISKENVSEVKRVFGNDVSHITAVFVRLQGRKVIQEVKKDGEEGRMPTHEENMVLNKIRNTFKDEDNILVEKNSMEPFFASRRGGGTVVGGEVVDLTTGKSRPMTENEIKRFMSYIDNMDKDPDIKSFFDDLNEQPDSDFIIDRAFGEQVDKMIEEMKKLLRFFEDD